MDQRMHGTAQTHSCLFELDLAEAAVNRSVAQLLRSGGLVGRSSLDKAFSSAIALGGPPRRAT